MTSGDMYRARACELLAQAKTAKYEGTRTKFRNLATAFMRLAQQAERNQELTVEFEIPSGFRSISKPEG